MILVEGICFSIQDILLVFAVDELVESIELWVIYVEAAETLPKILVIFHIVYHKKLHLVKPKNLLLTQKILVSFIITQN